MVLFGPYKRLLLFSTTYQGLVQSVLFCQGLNHPANIYLFKVSNRNTLKRCEICYKLAIKLQERRHCVACDWYSWQYHLHSYLKARFRYDF